MGWQLLLRQSALSRSPLYPGHDPGPLLLGSCAIIPLLCPAWPLLDLEARWAWPVALLQAWVLG